MSFNLIQAATTLKQQQQQVASNQEGEAEPSAPEFAFSIDFSAVDPETVRRAAGQSVDLPEDQSGDDSDQLSGANDGGDSERSNNVAGDESGRDDASDSDWAEASRGRYFFAEDPAVSAAITDSSDPSQQVCHNCKGRGHKSRNCPHQICRTCGALDSHATQRCPMTQRCYNCNRLGHVAGDCSERVRRQGDFCDSCGARTHLSSTCPQIWRLYVPPNDVEFHVSGAKATWQKGLSLYCYNCADSGHYGDDCPIPHRIRHLEPSAFCADNLPDPSLIKPVSHRQTGHGRRRRDEERTNGSAHGHSAGGAVRGGKRPPDMPTEYDHHHYHGRKATRGSRFDPIEARDRSHRAHYKGRHAEARKHEDWPPRPNGPSAKRKSARHGRR
ncbi:hypothetical protein PYCC9005_001490 [Savitreella phatthalungensis]